MKLAVFRKLLALILAVGNYLNLDLLKKQQRFFSDVEDVPLFFPLENMDEVYYSG